VRGSAFHRCRLPRSMQSGDPRRCAHAGADGEEGDLVECSYVIAWRHRGRQHTETHRTLALAREAQGKRRQAIASRPTSRERFEDYALGWLDSYQGRTNRGLSESTRSGYRHLIEQRAIPFFRAYRLAEIEPPDVRKFVVQLQREGLSPGSVVKVLAPLKAMFATAVDDGTLAVNPAATVRVNRRRDAEEEPEAKAMTRDELRRLRGKLPEPWTLFFDLLAETGLRISEALGLDWSGLQFGNRPTIKVRRQYYRGTLGILKTRNARRDLPLSADLARRLWAARPTNGSGPMFRTRNGGRYLDGNIRRDVLEPATKAARLEWVTFHTFRHTCASMLFDSGKNIAQVSKWLGHADPAFTLRTYVHLLDGGLGDALDAAQVNTGSTEGMQRTATGPRDNRPDSALQSESAERLHTAATA
jgi:integrase